MTRAALIKPDRSMTGSGQKESFKEQYPYSIMPFMFGDFDYIDELKVRTRLGLPDPDPEQYPFPYADIASQSRNGA